MMSFAMVEHPEPSIEEMLADPIVRALMAADGVRASWRHCCARLQSVFVPEFNYEEVQP
jgi:hypothetical protein